MRWADDRQADDRWADDRWVEVVRWIIFGRLHVGIEAERRPVEWWIGEANHKCWFLVLVSGFRFLRSNKPVQGRDKNQRWFLVSGFWFLPFILGPDSLREGFFKAFWRRNSLTCDWLIFQRQRKAEFCTPPADYKFFKTDPKTLIEMCRKNSKQPMQISFEQREISEHVEM